MFNELPQIWMVAFGCVRNYGSIVTQMRRVLKKTTYGVEPRKKSFVLKITKAKVNKKKQRGNCA